VAEEKPNCKRSFTVWAASETTTLGMFMGRETDKVSRSPPLLACRSSRRGHQNSEVRGPASSSFLLRRPRQRVAAMRTVGTRTYRGALN
jgi:hypothetical protein